ncbi:MAG: Ig-like domain-containing protein, partial [Gemmataceae bacterium]|nr:Ig-like domain-containing protein [Gemmataceae bacterium]
LVVQLVDQYGNAVSQSGVSVTFTAPSSGASATLSSSTVNTDANGQAQVTATANTVAGSYQVQVTSGSLTGVQFSLTNNPAALSQLAFSIQPPTSVSVGQRFRVQVQLRDQFGNVVRLPNVAIRLSLRAGSGLSGTLLKRTNASGLATFGDLSLSQPGRYRLVARLGNGLQVLSRVIVERQP